jgi:DnaJ-class molecular chaperone
MSGTNERAEVSGTAKCRRCRGTGWERVERAGRATFPSNCPRCSGAGWVPLSLAADGRGGWVSGDHGAVS